MNPRITTTIAGSGRRCTAARASAAADEMDGSRSRRCERAGARADARRAPATSHVAAAGHEPDMPRHVVGERGREEKHGTRGLLGTAGAAERDHRLRALAHLLRNPELDELPIDLLFDGLILRRREARLDEPIGDRIDVDVETPPLAREGLGDADDAHLARRVVHLTRVAR